ncbi:MAG: hypothetical protein PWQ43_265 [Rikenellaceae bacterium]|jgi:hypothetical protein|nr:hypothetical protein [Rikenellaceae bacterium]
MTIHYHTDHLGSASFVIDIELTNIFFNKAQNKGFNKNYSFGIRFTHIGNNNQIMHKDHLH